MKTKAKTKGKSKGNFKGKSKPKKKLKEKHLRSTVRIPSSFDLTLRGEYSLIGVIQLEERIRRIVREELDRNNTVTSKDFWEIRDKTSYKHGSELG